MKIWHVEWINDEIHGGRDGGGTRGGFDPEVCFQIQITTNIFILIILTRRFACKNNTIE